MIAAAFAALGWDKPVTQYEALVAERSPVVGIGVGPHADYGAAQRVYVRRGYLPDGRGVTRDGRPVPPGTPAPIDDEATLMFTKRLRREGLSCLVRTGVSGPAAAGRGAAGRAPGTEECGNAGEGSVVGRRAAGARARVED